MEKENPKMKEFGFHTVRTSVFPDNYYGGHSIAYLETAGKNIPEISEKVVRVYENYW